MILSLDVWDIPKRSDFCPILSPFVSGKRQQWCQCSMLMGSTATPDLCCISWKVWRSRCKRWKMCTSGRATTMVPWDRLVSSSSPTFFFCWSFIFWEFANCKFCFLKWYSTPWFFAGFWSSNGSVLPFFPLVFRRSPHPCFAIGCLWISLLRPEPTFLPPRCYRTAMWRKRLSGKDWTSLWPVDWPWELVAIWRWE